VKLLLGIGALLGLAFPGTALAGLSGPMKLVTFHRPADSACASTSGYATPTGASQTGIAWDGTHLLVSCWRDGYVDELSPSGAWQGRLQVTGLPGTGLGAISWDSQHGVLWACAIDSRGNRSNQVGSVAFGSTGTSVWQLRGSAPHGCVNNVEYRAGTLYADGAYVNSSGSSTHIDRSTVPAGLKLQLADSHTALWSPHVSGTIFTADGNLDWQADNYGTVKSIWHAGKRVEWGSLRFEQLACDEQLGRVYVKWFNENRFGIIDGFGC
jgi:hypothetical protein